MKLPERSARSPVSWFVSCAKGIESILAEELKELGANEVNEAIAGVYVSGPVSLGLQMCLWSRVANRVIRLLGEYKVATSDELYDALVVLPWHQWVKPTQSIAIDFHGTNDSLRNTQFSAQRVKDAIVDELVAACGARPNVDRARPDIRFNCHLRPQGLSVGIDYGDGSLHWRGYRSRSGAAPLKETLAAAILLRAGWPRIAAAEGALVDPMCGTGTLLIEGAMMAADIAPALNRKRFGFERLPDFVADQWRIMISEAQKRSSAGRLRLSRLELRGYDADSKAIRSAEENIEAVGLSKVIRVSVKSLAKLTKPTHRPISAGLLVCNPPYGERLGESNALKYLYNQLGERARNQFEGWQMAVLAGDSGLSKAVGLRSHKQLQLFNGPLPVTLSLFDLSSDNNWRGIDSSQVQSGSQNALDRPQQSESALSDGARMFLNRLRKNRRKLKPWLKRSGTTCYRLYDADMPEYAVAIDWYEGRLHVAEYQAPKHVDDAAALQRLDEVIHALCVEFDLEARDIALKQRRQQKGAAQYEKRDYTGKKVAIREGQAKLLVNLTDYLDTGLFLDHRPLRLRIASEAKNKTFLNLFCYTGTASVHAALGGAKKTLSVDLSNTYLNWYKENLALNGLSDGVHRSERADVMSWLENHKAQYDLILLDPPSFSNSKKTQDSFDVLRDQEPLVQAAMRCLTPAGTLYFSNNRRGFKLSPELDREFSVENISGVTLDPDFERNTKIHQCWRFRHKS